MEATSTTTGKFEVTQVTTPDSLAGQNSTPLSPSIGDQDSDPSTVRLIPADAAPLPGYRIERTPSSLAACWKASVIAKERAEMAGCFKPVLLDLA
ncbi:hypothetical protein MRX96_015254 [Rhipicephalus microplus]